MVKAPARGVKEPEKWADPLLVRKASESRHDHLYLPIASLMELGEGVVRVNMASQTAGPANAKLRRIAFIVLAAFIAHCVASYICLFATISRIEQLSSMASEPRKVPVGRRFKAMAPVRAFGLINTWKKV